MSRVSHPSLLGVAPVAALSVLIAGCSSSSNSPAGRTTPPGGTIAVDASDTRCDVSAPSFAAGRHTLRVTNTASQVTEVYVYATGDRIVGEVENIGPSTERSVIVDLSAGQYQVACKPGMVGDGNRTALKIT